MAFSVQRVTLERSGDVQAESRAKFSSSNGCDLQKIHGARAVGSQKMGTDPNDES